MIKPEEVFQIGQTTRPHGLRGEVEMTFTDDVFDRGEAPYFVLDMDGILVPFFWDEYRFKNSEAAIVKFENVETDAEARHVCGRRVFYAKKFVPQAEEGEALSSWRALTGFTVFTDLGVQIGTVDQVDDSSENILLYILSPRGEEVILPLHEDFITDISLAERTLMLALPEGLLTLNE